MSGNIIRVGRIVLRRSLYIFYKIYYPPDIPLLTGGAQFHGLAGHAVNDTRGFVLAHGVSPGVFHFQETGRAVISHAGTENSRGGPAGGLAHGTEKHIHGRFMPVDGRPVIDFDVIAVAVGPEKHVPAPGAMRAMPR